MPTAKSKKTGGTKSPSSNTAKKPKTADTTPQNENSKLMEFFEDALKDIYWAEKHLTKALPKMQKAATSEELKQAFEDHLSATQDHVSRLEDAFEMLGKKAQAKKCEAMVGLTNEGENIIEDTE